MSSGRKKLGWIDAGGSTTTSSVGSPSKKPKLHDRIVGNPVNSRDVLLMRFSATHERPLEIDEIVAVPRRGDRFDYGSILLVKDQTIACLLGYEPMLKKELPVCLCGVFDSPSTNELDKIDVLEKSSQEIHHWVATTDPTLLTPPVRYMVSFVQSHLTKTIATLMRQCIAQGKITLETPVLHEEPEVNTVHSDDTRCQTTSADVADAIVHAQKTASTAQLELLLKIVSTEETRWQALRECLERIQQSTPND